MSFNNDNSQVNIGAAVNEALAVPVLKDARIAAKSDFSSPNAAAALAYMKEITSKDGLCGIPTEIFLENILKGRSREEANAEATQAYLQAYNSGERLVPGSPCAKADLAWREAVVAGTPRVDGGVSCERFASGDEHPRLSNLWTPVVGGGRVAHFARTQRAGQGKISAASARAVRARAAGIRSRAARVATAQPSCFPEGTNVSPVCTGPLINTMAWPTRTHIAPCSSG